MTPLSRQARRRRRLPPRLPRLRRLPRRPLRYLHRRINVPIRSNEFFINLSRAA